MIYDIGEMPPALRDGDANVLIEVAAEGGELGVVVADEYEERVVGLFDDALLGR